MQFQKSIKNLNSGKIKEIFLKIKQHSYQSAGYKKKQRGLLLLGSAMYKMRQKSLVEPMNILKIKFTGRMTAAEKIIGLVERKQTSVFGKINSRFSRDRGVVAKAKMQMMVKSQQSTDEDEREQDINIKGN